LKLQLSKLGAVQTIENARIYGESLLDTEHTSVDKPPFVVAEKGRHFTRANCGGNG
jgi:hypothetical protein